MNVIAGFREKQYDGGLLYFLIGATYSQVFNGVGSLPYPGGVDKTESDALQVDGILDGIPGGSFNMAYNGPLLM